MYHTLIPYSVMFPPGMTSVPLNIPIYDDDIFEGQRFFILTIISSSLPTGVVSGYPNHAGVSIVDCKL